MNVFEGLVRELEKRNLTITAAESCTGGMFQSNIVDINGASSVFKEGFVTYSNEAKIKYLGVDKKILSKYGAVSFECAVSMAKGVYNLTGADIAVAITGLAGPTGDDSEKPIGTVFFAVETKDNTYTYHCLYQGPRYGVREKACKFIAGRIIELLENNTIKAY